MSRPAPLAQVDVFTAEPFAGNPAAIVRDAEAIPEATLGRIGAEMSLPATAFVTAASQPGADLNLRCAGRRGPARPRAGAGPPPAGPPRRGS